MINISGIRNLTTVNNIWFTSDHYFNDDYISSNFRTDYNDVEHMNEDYISKWNKKVRKNDVVFHVGNFSSSSPQDIKKILERLNGKIYLIIGDIDTNSTILSCKELLLGSAYKLDIYVDNLYISLNHFPQKYWNRYHENSIHVHGNVRWNEPPYDMRAIDVSVDGYDGNPIDISEILLILEKRKTYYKKFLTIHQNKYI